MTQSSVGHGLYIANEYSLGLLTPRCGVPGVIPILYLIYIKNVFSSL